MKERSGWVGQPQPLGSLHHVRIPQLEEQISELLKNTSRQRKGLFSPPKATINIQRGVESRPAKEVVNKTKGYSDAMTKSACICI